MLKMSPLPASNELPIRQSTSQRDDMRIDPDKIRGMEDHDLYFPLPSETHDSCTKMSREGDRGRGRIGRLDD
jgi:hypothetical protein